MAESAERPLSITTSAGATTSANKKPAAAAGMVIAIRRALSKPESQSKWLAVTGDFVFMNAPSVKSFTVTVLKGSVKKSLCVIFRVDFCYQ
ncbi:hypothetical protein [Leptothrix ochracea]|uniref:hypothetical protein n=1 Tax=Leptothrix ochracea TaxID=735331 RepID=UPI0005C45565|nr:hypothetical protein [Leptothrix ochracea]